jgi:hypothetical protein
VHFGYIDVEVADRVGLELLLGQLVAIHLGLAADAMALGQGSQAVVTILYCPTDCLCRRGAPMEN